MPKVSDTKKVFLTKIQALYDMEKELEKSLPKMEKAAHDPALKESFHKHLEETKEHSARLEDIFESLGEKPKKLKSEGIRGIIEDGKWVMQEVDAPDEIKDEMIASSARNVEHYEMAGYMSAIEEADFLELDEASELLKQTLEEEKATDEVLSSAMKESMELMEEAVEYER